MVNVVVETAFFILAIVCLASSLPFDKGIKDSSTPALVKDDEQVASNADGVEISALKETTKAEVVSNETETTSTQEVKKDVKEEIEKDVKEATGSNATVKDHKENETKEEPTKEDQKEVEKEIVENKPIEVSEMLIPVTTNGSKDVYVIKTIVYEVGILTEANDSTNDTESHEEVNLTFFNPKHNDSIIDLSNIPVPIQTNISGVTITGLAPANFGTIQLSDGDNPATLTSNFPLPVAPLLPSAVISVKHNISTTNTDKETELLSNLPNLLGLTSPITGETLKVETSTVAKDEEHKKEEKDSDSSEESSEESNEDSKESSEEKEKS